MAEERVDMVVGFRDAATAGLQGINDQLKQMRGGTQNLSNQMTELGNSLRGVSLAAGVMGAALVGIGVKAVKDFSTVGDEIQKMSIRTGIATESISALRVAAELGGTSIDAVELGLRHMQKGLVGVTDEGIKLSPVIEALGINLEAFKKMTPDKQFEQLGNAIASIEDPIVRNNAAMAVFGTRLGTQLIPLFDKGKFSIDEMRKVTEKLGVSFDQVAADKAAKLNDELKMLQLKFEGVFLSLGEALIPAVMKFATAITPVIEGLTKWITAHPVLTAHLLEGTIAVLGIVAALAPLLLMIPKLILAFQALSVVIGPAGLLIGAFIAISFFLKGLRQDLSDLHVHWYTIWNAIVQINQDAANLILIPINLIIDGLNALGGSYNQVHANFQSLKFVAAQPTFGPLRSEILSTGSATQGLNIDLDALNGALGGSGGSGADAAKKMADGLKSVGEAALKLKDDIASALSDISKNIADLHKQMDDLTIGKATDDLSQRSTLADAYVKEQEDLKGLRKQFADSKDNAERAQLQDQIDKLDADLKAHANIEISLATEVSTAKGNLLKTDLDKALDAFNLNNLLTDQKFQKDMSALDGKLAKELDTQKAILDIQASAEKASLAFMLEGEKHTIESVNRQIAAYNEMAKAVANAKAGIMTASVSLAGTNAATTAVSKLATPDVQLSAPTKASINNVTVNVNNAQVLSSDDVMTKIGDPIVKALQQHMALPSSSGGGGSW